MAFTKAGTPSNGKCISKVVERPVMAGEPKLAGWQYTIENRGWQHIANKLDDESDKQDMAFFAKLFNGWQKEVILLIEYSYHKDYDYVTPLGVFTHLGTLARRLQGIFVSKEISASLTDSILRFHIGNNEVKDVRRVYECRFVELDQAWGGAGCDGWKVKKTLLGDKEVAELVENMATMRDIAEDSMVRLGLEDK